jgi:hypothetical protein
VKADQVGRLWRLVAAHGEEDFELACRRALHFAANEGALVVGAATARFRTATKAVHGLLHGGEAQR